MKDHSPYMSNKTNRLSSQMLSSIASKFASSLVMLSHQKDKTYEDLRRHIFKSLDKLKFNLPQAALGFYFMDLIIDRLYQNSCSKASTRNSFDLGVAIAHKLTEDYAFSPLVLKKVLGNPQLSELENLYYSKLQFDLLIDENIFNQYVKILRQGQ